MIVDVDFYKYGSAWSVCEHLTILKSTIPKKVCAKVYTFYLYEYIFIKTYKKINITVSLWHYLLHENHEQIAIKIHL